MAYSLFFEHTGLNIGSAGNAWSAWMSEEAIVRPLTNRFSDPVLADSLEQQWDITITLEQGPTRGNEL